MLALHNGALVFTKNQIAVAGSGGGATAKEFKRSVPAATSRGGRDVAMAQVRRLVNVTISGHTVTMKQVRIAELKARLSEYLRAVRMGETIAVLDRETPVAQIVPVRDRHGLRVRKPAPGTPTPNRVPLPKPLKTNIDVVQLLLEERQSHR